MKFLLLLLVSVPVTLISTEILTPYTNKNTKHEYGGYSSYEDRHKSPETFSMETYADEDRHAEKVDKVKKLLVMLQDLKERHYRKKKMRLSDRVADPNMIQDHPQYGWPFKRVVIPQPPRPKRILLKRGKRRRRRRRRKIRRRLGLKLRNNFNFRRIRKAYKERLFTRIFVCFFNVFC